MSTADRLGSVQGKGRAGPGPAGEGRKPVAGRCVELAMTHRFSVPVRLCDAPHLLRRETWFAPNVPLAHVLAPPRPTPLPSAGNWVRFSCWIPPLFVLSHSLPMINTTGKLGSFCAFLSPLAPSLRIHWPQFSPPLATRHSPLPPTTLPRWRLHDTDRRLSKTERGPISTSGPSISLCAEPGDSCAQFNPFLPTRRRSPVDRSLVAGGAPRQRLEACLPDAHRPQRLFSRCSP